MKKLLFLLLPVVAFSQTVVKYHLFNVFPSQFSDNITYRIIVDTKNRTQIYRVNATLFSKSISTSDYSYHKWVQFGSPTSFPVHNCAIPYPISATVLFRGRPIKIPDRIIGVSVFPVAGKHSMGSFPNKGFQNQHVNATWMMLAVFSEKHGGISTFGDVGVEPSNGCIVYGGRPIAFLGSPTTGFRRIDVSTFISEITRPIRDRLHVP